MGGQDAHGNEFYNQTWKLVKSPTNKNLQYTPEAGMLVKK